MRVRDSSNCSIILTPDDWRIGDPLSVCILSRPGPGKSDLAKARRAVLASMMDFIDNGTEGNARERLRHEVLCSEEGPLSCKQSNGCIQEPSLVSSRGNPLWSRLVEVTQDLKGELPFIHLESECYIKVYLRAVSKPYILVYGPDPTTVNQAAGKVQETIRGLVGSASQKDDLFNTRSMKSARTSPDRSFEQSTTITATYPEPGEVSEQMAIAAKNPSNLLEVEIPGWLFEARTDVYDHIFGTAPEALANALEAQAGCEISEAKSGSLRIYSGGNKPDFGQMIHLVEDSLLRILKIENDEAAKDRLLYDLSEKTRRNSPYQRRDADEIMQTRNIGFTRHPWWTWARALPVKRHGDDKVEFHGRFLGKLKPPDVSILIYEGKHEPKLCEPYIIVKGAHLEKVKWAVKVVKDHMIRHQQNCDCIPKWK